MAKRNNLDKVQRFPLGVPIERVLLVGGATRMPSIGRFLKRMTGLSASPSVNPEESVALGAAVQAAILDGTIKQQVFNPFFHEQGRGVLETDGTPKAPKRKGNVFDI